MKRWKKILCVMLAMLLFVEIVPATPEKAASKDKVTIAEFVEDLEKATGQEGILKEGEFADTSENITWVDAAVLTNRADEMKNGSSYNKDLYEQVKTKKRIAGLSQIPKNKVSAVRKCFVKGLIVGENNGKYSQNRKFRGNDAITRAEADKVLQRLKSKKKRIKLSPDGQVIRTTNLPKNYKKYDYILESFPNSFYEKRFRYQFIKYSYKPVNLKDYACPKDMKKTRYTLYGEEGSFWKDVAEKHLDEWCKKVETNLETRLSFNYKTVDQKWINQLRKTYRKGMDAKQNKAYIDDIKKYVKKAKQNKVVIKCAKVVVEPSTLYKEDANKYLRCYVKFKVNAKNLYSAKSDKQNELIYSIPPMNNIALNLKQGKWYEGVFDIALGMSYFGDMGEDYGVQRDSLWVWK